MKIFLDNSDKIRDNDNIYASKQSYIICNTTQF